MVVKVNIKEIAYVKCFEYALHLMIIQHIISCCCCCCCYYYHYYILAL